MPIPVPLGVQVEISPVQVRATGPLGVLEERLPRGVSAALKDGWLTLSLETGGQGADRALYGTTRARVANAVAGVHAGFSKILEIVGLGFKAQAVGEKLVLALGFSHTLSFPIPKGVKVAIDPKMTQLTLSGPDKDLIGQTAAQIRGLKPPEHYKGTGIRYRGEHITRKAGKTAAGASSASGGGGAKKA